MSVQNLIGQILSCVCVFLVTRFLGGWAYVPIIRIITMVLCVVSLFQSIAIGYTAKSLIEKKE